jgi:hypothetical protein
MVILTRKEKEGLVVQLASQGKTTRQIARLAHVSLKDIGTIIRRFTGEESDVENKSQSISSKAFQMFKGNKSRVEVAIALNLEADDVVTLFENYLRLLNFDKLITIYRELGKDICLLDDLFFQMKEEGIATKSAITRFVQMAGRLSRLDEEELKICEQIGKLNSKKFELEKEIEEALKELELYSVSLREKQLL